MKRRTFIQSSVGLGLLAQLSSEAAAQLHWQTTTFTGLGTTLSIRAAHADADKLDEALAQARREVARMEDAMSLFRPGSAINQLNRDGVLLNPPEDFLRILSMSLPISARSQGAFDITVQPLWALYFDAQQRGRLPSADEIHAVRQRVGWQFVQVSAGRVTFAKAGMGITLNGIAQGYASDLVRAHLKRSGIVHALIDMGEWSSLGQSDGQRDWTLGIADPHQADRLTAQLRMNGLCVATSSDAQCSFSPDRVHHHILNPKTGDSPVDISSVTVAAQTCTQADALTKVLFVAGYARALDLARVWNVGALVVHKNGQWKASSGLMRQMVA